MTNAARRVYEQALELSDEEREQLIEDLARSLKPVELSAARRAEIASLLDAETFPAAANVTRWVACSAISPDGSETEQTVVGDITYDAKGRREEVAYGPTVIGAETTAQRFGKRLVRGSPNGTVKENVGAQAGLEESTGVDVIEKKSDGELHFKDPGTWVDDPARDQRREQ